MRNVYKVGAVALVGALGLAACGSSSDSGNNGGGGGDEKTVVISSDLPLQGASKNASDSANGMIETYLDSIGYKVGNFKIEFKKYDDSTAAAGQWDANQCTKNANDHVANSDEVAVMGTYNTGCAKLIIPILNQDPDGPMLMVSHANTGTGLTKPADPGEPDKYYPTGKRNYARVVPSDEIQGGVAATYMKELGGTKCAVINDNQTYGIGVANSFAEAAQKLGITITSNTPWDAKQPNYQSFFQTIKAQNPDCLYIGGIFDNNGGQLVKDKVAILGDNDKVKTMAPDGFEGYPELLKLPQGEGIYLTFPGLPVSSIRESSQLGAKILDAYKAKFGSDPTSSYSTYAVAAMQVILAALEKSDGTRASITNAVFSGDGIDIPADQSILGDEIKISTETGDTAAKVYAVLRLEGGQEKFVKKVDAGAS